MKTLEKTMIQQQMDDLIHLISHGKKVTHPRSGWIRSIRLGLGMSLRQLAGRLGLSVNTTKNFEIREQLGTITIGSLKKIADAMDMDLIYYFNPRSGSIEKMIEQQAKKKAFFLLQRSSQTMKLEDQETSQKSQERELSRITKELKEKMPTRLWD